MSKGRSFVEKTFKPLTLFYYLFILFIFIYLFTHKTEK